MLHIHDILISCICQLHLFQYEVVFSVGNNNTIATIYNVGKIKKDTLPSAKLIAEAGRIAYQIAGKDYYNRNPN